MAAKFYYETIEVSPKAIQEALQSQREPNDAEEADDPDKKPKKDKGGGKKGDNKEIKPDKKKQNNEPTIAALVTKIVPCAHQSLIELMCFTNEISPTAKYNESLSAKVLKVSTDTLEFYNPKNKLQNGFLYFKKDSPTPFEFSPVKLDWTKSGGGEVTEQQQPNFDVAVQKYFDQFRQQETEAELNEKVEKEALRKFNKIKEDQDKRLVQMKEEIELSMRRARAIELSSVEVNALSNIIRTMIDAGTGGLVKASIDQGKAAGDKLASLVTELKMNTMKALLKLNDPDGNGVDVEVDLNLSAAQNANKYYENRSKLISKQQKTEAAAQVALKKAKISAQMDVKKQKMLNKKKAVQQARRALWFEKFYWFISSENFLVISARDAPQNEVLIKRYVQKNDIIFHAQIVGAAFTVVKNPKGVVIPPTTLNEAALAAMSHSRAWDSKVAVEVYWVRAEQVSKSAPTGLYLPMGSFMIYGKKNFLEPSKMEMGFALIWRVDEDSAKNHEGERAIKVLDPDALVPHSDSAPVIAPDTQGELLELDKKEESNSGKGILDKLVAKQANEPTMVTKDTTKTKTKQKPKQKKGQQKEKEPEEPPKKPESKNQKTKATKKEKEKLKKYAEKFADEDADEAELRMKTLGFKKNTKLEELKNREIFAKKEEVQEPEKTETSVKEPAKNEKKNPKEKKEANPEVKESKDDKEAKPEQKEEEQIKKKPKEPKKKEQAEKEEENEEEEEIDNNEEDFKQLTGTPNTNDVLYDALPICAPYSVVSNYKYKVKLLPGTLKKGKILKSAMELFTRSPEILEKEKEIIQSLPDNVAVMQVLGNCKIQAAGLLKMNMQKKKGQK